jgi:hypothetical protein
MNIGTHSEYSANYIYADLEQHISYLLQAQLKLARMSHSESTYALVLHQRLTVLKRVLYAFSTKYDSKEKVKYLGVKGNKQPV